MTRFISPAILLAAVSAAAPPQPADLLAQMRASIERFVQQAPSLVAREEYSQIVSNSGRGAAEQVTLVSELLMVRLPRSAGWISFRDVMSVNGRRLEGRQQRLVELLQSPRPDALAEARRLANESARYNIGRITRTLNVPDIGVEYLRNIHAARMDFEEPRPDKINGADVMLLRFEEISGPTIIKDVQGRDLKASGRVWINESGALVRTELNVRDRASVGRCIVDFVQNAAIGLRVPQRMTESYRSAGEEISGVATYSDYRQFAVSTSETVAKPPPR